MILFLNDLRDRMNHLIYRSRRMKKAILIFFCCFGNLLFGQTIDTFYGPIAVEEEVILDLINSDAFQRLKQVHQYGVSYYTTHKEEYTRYDHSLGVFAILRLKNASLKEQIAGLLHDVSHTVFSHVGDWLFYVEHQDKDYQGSHHLVFLEESGLSDILRRHQILPEEIIPVEEAFPMLEQKSPNLCADRIDYNIQGAYYQNFISREEGISILNDLQFVDGKWVSHQIEPIRKIVRFSLFMSEHCWGSPHNHLTSTWLADSLRRALTIGALSYEDIHFGCDDYVWQLLCQSKDPMIQENMKRVLHAKEYYQIVDIPFADLVVVSKFRGVDPWILKDGKEVRLTNLDKALCNDYDLLKEKMRKGWGIKLGSK